MTTITLNIPDPVLLEALQAAAAAEIELEELLLTRITASADQEEEPAIVQYNPEEVAQSVYQCARNFKVNDEFTVEELHRIGFGTPAWKALTAGQRIALGKAFRKLAEARTQVMTGPDGFPKGFISFERKDAQNRAIYSFQNSTSRPK
ncbi:single-stranded DNA-binding protein [Burkholderia cepacia]|uniref:single-stranded DNA-binding protein n=1 Tax=Burkholderia cepacia TaxID=292 RepID=UPI001CF30108|nr:single-stranded DNA-binding protein [Burkholderia cepacia]MCA8113897.1 single-stranded DNA-binding protein [Burkholderia cepacia]MCA8400587.1 single-stranded DNA-binding protein [Burkholderia cepacia]